MIPNKLKDIQQQNCQYFIGKLIKIQQHIKKNKIIQVKNRHINSQIQINSTIISLTVFSSSLSSRSIISTSFSIIINLQQPMKATNQDISSQAISDINVSELNHLQSFSQQNYHSFPLLPPLLKYEIKNGKIISQPHSHQKLHAIKCRENLKPSNQNNQSIFNNQLDQKALSFPPTLIEKKQIKQDQKKQIDMSERFELSKSDNLLQNIQEQKQENKNARIQQLLHLDQHFIMAESQALDVQQVKKSNLQRVFSYMKTLEIQQQEEFSYYSDQMQIKQQQIQAQFSEKEYQLSPTLLSKQYSQLETQEENYFIFQKITKQSKSPSSFEQQHQCQAVQTKFSNNKGIQNHIMIQTQDLNYEIQDEQCANTLAQEHENIFKQYANNPNQNESSQNLDRDKNKINLQEKINFFNQQPLETKNSSVRQASQNYPLNHKQKFSKFLYFPLEQNRQSYIRRQI